VARKPLSIAFEEISAGKIVGVEHVEPEDDGTGGADGDGTAAE
jgi:hypothetical protein